MEPAALEDGVTMALRRPALVSIALAGLLVAGCDDAMLPPPVDRAAIAAAARDIAAAPPPRATWRTPEQDAAMLRRVADRTIRAAQPFCQAELGRGCDFRMTLLPSPAPSALAHGADGITVTTGLMRLVSNDDELAGVVAHEIAHHIAGHLASGTRRMRIAATLGAAVGRAAQDVVGLDIGLAQLGAETGAKAAQLTFSKSQEREADYLGAFIAAGAGHDLERAGGLWAKLTKLSGDQVTSWFDTHPAGPERLAIWRRAAGEIAREPKAMPRRGGWFA